MDPQQTPQLYLASSSPRRSELLKQLQLDFLVIHPGINETINSNEKYVDYVQRLALAKAKAGAHLPERIAHIPVLGADTIVVVDNKILGKPTDKKQGIMMLELLSGKVHQVLTAVAMTDGKRAGVKLSTSLVCFRILSLAEIEAYWHTDEPMDKAGGYAIQGLGSVFIKWIEGSYSGVMGLPAFEAAELLAGFGIKVIV